MSVSGTHIRVKDLPSLQKIVNPQLNRCQECHSLAFLRQLPRVGNESSKDTLIGVYVSCMKCNYRTKGTFPIAFPYVNISQLTGLLAAWNSPWKSEPNPEPEPKPAEEPAPVKRKPGRPRKSASTDGQPSN